MNHNSIFDNFILAKISEYNDFKWKNIRTVSGVSSSRSIQNRTLELHECLLLRKNISDDIKNLNLIKNKWINCQYPLQIILFPEGTIYEDITLREQSDKRLEKIINHSFKNVLCPKIGIFSSLIETFSDKIDNIYDITAVYTYKNKRIYGELNILDHISKPEFKIEVKIGKDRQSDDQKNYEHQITRAGGIYYIAKDFDSFFHWYNETFGDLGL